MIDLRFPTALQLVLTLAVAHERGVLCTSGELATGLGANPALVRKLMVGLGRDGIVTSSVGRNGGIRLLRSPETITLLDIYRAAVDDKRLFATRSNINGNCVVSRNIERFFQDLTDEAGEQLSSLLAGKTVAQSLDVIRALNDASGNIAR
jgi:Rrf2 family transcriptional repressor of oqxAB